MSKLKLAIVIGSIRPNRFGGHAAQWIEEIARRRGDFEVELIDLKDYPMPLFAEEASPLYAPSKDEAARRWQKKVGEFDAFIFTAAEYNRGPTAVLKNALDYARTEWNNKPVAFVGYGGVGGARAVEQLRLHAIELQMTPIRNARSHPVSRLPGGDQRRQAAERTRASQSGGRADARSAGMVDRSPQSGAREELAPGCLVGGTP
jgi:NAD(P)H-dependent FMN reductase